MENNSTITIVLDNPLIEKLKKFYNNSFVSPKNKHVDFMAKVEGASITVYKSNKVVFQGPNSTTEASLWGDTNKKWKYTDAQIGSDEVGTGDYFGPIAVCAAYVEAKDMEFLNSLGIGDSKKISDSKILKLAPILLEKIPYSQISVNPQKYNNLIKNGYNQARIKAMLHNQVLYNLKQKIKKKDVFFIVDQFLSEKKYFEYLSHTDKVVKETNFETKAEDNYPAVAVASIIARYSFLTKLEAMSKVLKQDIPKGAGIRVDRFAQALVDFHGFDILKKTAKLHFANTKKIKINN